MRDNSSRGQIRGKVLWPQELDQWHTILRNAQTLAQPNSQAQLLVHGQNNSKNLTQAQKKQHALIQKQISQGRAKRYVLKVTTSSGPKVFKIVQPQSAGNKLLGLLGTSTAQVEHRNHLRCESLELAATRTLGYLELRRGPFLIRACQIQEPIQFSSLPLLDTFFPEQLALCKAGAIQALADAIAQTHLKGFFHNDLKGFHAFIKPKSTRASGITHYELQWIDLARVGFKLSERQRIINLYQVFRYILPSNEDAQEKFIDTYCAVSGWFSHDHLRALQKIRQFLDYKLRTHPNP